MLSTGGVRRVHRELLRFWFFEIMIAKWGEWFAKEHQNFRVLKREPTMLRIRYFRDLENLHQQ